MPWLQIRFTVERDQVPLLEAALENAGALAVTLDDAGDDPLLEPDPGTLPLWDRVRLSALFEDDPSARALVHDLAARLGAHCRVLPHIESIEDRPWERVWLDDFRPTRFGCRLWVCPQGQAAPDPQAIVVNLDPGLAFGTGHHATTALCLEWLDGAPLLGKTVLDYGCGSGILAIAALKLGAAHVIALDHDPQAIEATSRNAVANGVAERLSLCLPAELGRYAAGLPVDLVLANILVGPLVDLAEDLVGLVREGGDLVLSGVLSNQVDRIRAAYGERIALSNPRLLEDWALIQGVKGIGASVQTGAASCP